MLLRAPSLAVALVIGLALGRLLSHQRNRKATNYSTLLSTNSLQRCRRQEGNSMRQNKFWFAVGGFLTMFAMAPGPKGFLFGIRTSKSREDQAGRMSRLSLWRTICFVCVVCALE